MRVLLVLLIAGLGCSSVQAFYDASGPVIGLTSFSKVRQQPDALWLVEFYAPWCGHCKNLKPEWERAAQALKGIVNVGAVDADAHKELGGEFGVRGFPTIKLFHNKGGKLKAIDYNGGRTAKDIVEWALSQASKVALSRIGAKASGGGAGYGSGGGGAGTCGGGGGGGGANAGSCGGGGGGGSGGGGGGGGENFYGSSSDVVQLTDANFHEEVSGSDDLWMVEFFAPWCGHCKSLKPHYDKYATEVKGKVKVGAVDCTANQATCSEFGVNGYPTLKFFGSNKERPLDYNGGRDTSGLVDFSLEKWQAQLPPPQVRELTEQETFTDECLGHEADEALGLGWAAPKQLCFIAFLPHILDSRAAGRRSYIQILQDLSAKFKTRPFSYFWAEGGSQPELEANLGVGGYGYPALVALNPAKLKYAALRSAFEAEHVNEFVNRVRQGFEQVAPVLGDLAEVKAVEPWDGSDGVEVQEEEFSLDDIMGEEL